MKDKYCFDMPQGGSKSLDILDYFFNDNTQAFLLKAGLKKGMGLEDNMSAEYFKRFVNLLSEAVTI